MLRLRFLRSEEGGGVRGAAGSFAQGAGRAASSRLQVISHVISIHIDFQPWSFWQIPFVLQNCSVSPFSAKSSPFHPLSINHALLGALCIIQCPGRSTQGDPDALGPSAPTTLSFGLGRVE